MSTSLYGKSYTDEFPHLIEIVEKKLLSDTYKGGRNYDWMTVGSFKAFMDTPTTSEQLKYHQMDEQVDRALYTPYDTKFKRTDRIRYENIVYEVVGDKSDQGGQHEINRTMLRRLPDGTY